jgi:hypothetical protein
MTDNVREFLIPLLKLVCDEDLYNALIFSYDEEGNWQAAFVCNDFFYWGTADATVIPEQGGILALQMVLDDCKEIDQELGAFEAPLLFCARMNGMRPQGAYYASIAKAFWPLYDQCGPKREIGVGNPYFPGEKMEPDLGPASHA